MRHAFLTCLVLLLAATTSIAQTFSNPQFIGTTNGFGSAQPFPSTINVGGVSGPVGSVVVTLRGVFASRSHDLVVGLRSPGGTIYPILSECGGAVATSGTFAFVPNGLAAPYVANPGMYGVSVCSPSFFLFGVSGPIGDLGDVIGSSDVNGVWSLYVFDPGQNNQDVYIIDGWSITFGPVASAPAASERSITYQGRVSDSNGPVNSEVIAGFKLFDDAIAGTRRGAPLLMRVTPEDGLFAVNLDFGTQRPLDADTPMWLEVTLDGNVLSPRQRITPAPRALRATIANVAEAAGTANSATFAQSATIAASALNADHAALADFATNAGAAGSASVVPWSGITGVPNNVANLRVNPATLPNSATIVGPFGVGAEPASTSRLLVQANIPAATQWHIELTNPITTSFRGGLRLSDAGFLEITNNAASSVAFFARLSSTGAWTVASDARLKSHVRPATDMLDAAMKLRPVYFHWLNEDAGSAEDFGLIAQEVRGVLPRLVTGDESKETLTVNYSQLSVVAIAAIQELKARHEAELAATREILGARADAQQEQIDALRSANDDLIKRIERLELRHAE